jgi:hypothetical protein
VVIVTRQNNKLLQHLVVTRDTKTVAAQIQSQYKSAKSIVFLKTKPADSIESAGLRRKSPKRLGVG